jgi:hypothetical protein
MQYFSLTKYKEVSYKYGRKATLIFPMTKSERHFLPNWICHLVLRFVSKKNYTIKKLQIFNIQYLKYNLGYFHKYCFNWQSGCLTIILFILILKSPKIRRSLFSKKQDLEEKFLLIFGANTVNISFSKGGGRVVLYYFWGPHYKKVRNCCPTVQCDSTVM